MPPADDRPLTLDDHEPEPSPLEGLDPTAHRPEAPIDALDDDEPEPSPLAALPDPGLADDALLAPLDDDEPEPSVLPALPDPTAGVPVVPWRLETRLLGTDELLPTTLDPTRERSRLLHPHPADLPLQLVIDLGPVQLVGHPQVVEAPSASLILGRDLLAGRVLIRVD